MLMTQTLPIVIRKEGKWFVAEAPFLGVVSQGKTVETAKKNIKEAVELYLEDSPETKRALREEFSSAPFLTTLEVRV